MAGLVVWVPMLAGDDDIAASTQTEGWMDQRVKHWWDGDRDVSKVFGHGLGLESPAWDVYLLYAPGIRWEGEQPPAPCYWMHQLAGPGADPAFLLGPDPSRLSRELDSL